MIVRFITHKDKKELEECANCKVSYTEKQPLTEEQKAVARENIGVPSKEDAVKAVLAELQTWTGGSY